MVYALRTSIRKRSSWPKQTAIIVSDSPNMHLHLRELLRSYSWQVVDSTPKIQHAINALRTGMAFLVILDDTEEQPVATRLRSLVVDPITSIAPILAFTNNGPQLEDGALRWLGAPEIVTKPLTPAKFLPGFVTLLKRWESQPYVTLRKASYAIIGGAQDVAIKVLEKLRELESIHSLTTRCLANLLVRQGDLIRAERILLEALKNEPRDLATMMVLGHLYMHAAMPKLAYRLFLGAKNSYSSSMAVVPDLVQAAIMMGDLDAAIQHLYQMEQAGYLPEMAKQYLARLLFSQGRQSEVEKVLANQVMVKKLKNAWESAENQLLAKAS